MGKGEGADLICPQRREGMGEASLVLFFRKLKDEANVNSLGAHGGFEKTV